MAGLVFRGGVEDEKPEVKPEVKPVGLMTLICDLPNSVSAQASEHQCWQQPLARHCLVRNKQSLC